MSFISPRAPGGPLVGRKALQEQVRGVGQERGVRAWRKQQGRDAAQAPGGATREGVNLTAAWNARAGEPNQQGRIPLQPGARAHAQGRAGLRSRGLGIFPIFASRDVTHPLLLTHTRVCDTFARIGCVFVRTFCGSTRCAGRVTQVSRIEHACKHVFPRGCLWSAYRAVANPS